jgi:hypothetical protein
MSALLAEAKRDLRAAANKLEEAENVDLATVDGRPHQVEYVRDALRLSGRARALVAAWSPAR